MNKINVMSIDWDKIEEPSPYRTYHFLIGRTPIGEFLITWDETSNDDIN
jgi:hypothetical protein